MPVKDDSLVAQYIRAIENPDSTGFADGRWYLPNKRGYDANNRGFGVDVIHNMKASTLTKDRVGKWLTEDEERTIRNSHIDDSVDALERKAPSYILRNPPSEEKQAMAVGMLYRGDSVMQNPSVRDAYLSGSDDDMQKAVFNYYQSRKVSERAQRHNQFFSPNQFNTKKDNVPGSIRKSTSYTPPSYKRELFVPGKEYSEGGFLGNPWDNLSMQDKAEMIKVAVANGVTALPEIRSAYNEFARGGRKDTTSNTQKAMSYLMGKGISKTGASAIVGTLQAESNLDPTVHARMRGDDGEGLAQWTGNRKKAFWNTLERIEPGAHKRYGNIVNVPLERQLDVVLAERPDVTHAIHSAKDVQTATDIMLRGYENGGGTIGTMANRNQMNNIYGKWNNGYDRQMSRRLDNANNLLGIHIDPSEFLIPQETFDTVNAQLNTLKIPQAQMSNGMDTDPSTLYKSPVIDDTLFAHPQKDDEGPAFTPQEDRLEGVRRFNSVMGMMGRSTPLSIMGESNEPGILSYVNALYGS